MSAEFCAGQEVILRTPSYRSKVAPTDRKVVVERVARKYVYVQDGWRERAFHRETGLERGESNYPSSIGTAEMFAERDRLANLRSRLSELTSSYGWVSKLDTGQIEKILEALGAES